MKILKGVCVWLAQAALTMAAFCALTLSMWLPGPWYDIFAWGLMPGSRRRCARTWPTIS